LIDIDLEWKDRGEFGIDEIRNGKWG
jgi:hypothetical protein